MTAESTAGPSSSPFSSLISQHTITVPEFELDSGVKLRNVPVAYKTWGTLNAERDNCLIICHALTGSADVEDWWGPLLGLNRAFDPTRWFIFCGNVIGSPYGTVSSVTTNPETGKPYGPEMPGSTIKDDVRLHYIVLQQLEVASVAAVVGGSMGGMLALEYPLNTPPGFVRHVVALATSARHSAWCISWGEAQRQSIYSDPEYRDGYYYEVDGGIDFKKQPARGLSAARMAALLTYRSRDSFESRFGRRSGNSKVPKGGVRIMGGPETTDPSVPSTAELERDNAREKAWREHNDGHRSASGDGATRAASPRVANGKGEHEPPKIFSAQSYLRYQGDKFTGRFDANCYIHITRKLDTHDLSHPSRFKNYPTPSAALPPVNADDPDSVSASLEHALSLLPPALVIGIESDGLFTTSEQKEIAAHVPDAELVVIPSPDGHDGFLLEFQAINGWVEGWLKRKMPQYYTEEARMSFGTENGEEWTVKKESVFGEAEADVTRW